MLLPTDRLETSPYRSTLCCGESLGRKQQSGNKARCRSCSPTSVLCQHRGCMTETCCVLGFNRLFVLHTTSPKFPPSARWPSRLNPQPGHLTAHLFVAGLILIISRFTPSPTSSRHVRKNNSLKCVLFYFFFSLSLPHLQAPDCFGCGEGKKIHERWWGILRDRSSLAWFYRKN